MKIIAVWAYEHRYKHTGRNNSHHTLLWSHKIIPLLVLPDALLAPKIYLFACLILCLSARRQLLSLKLLRLMLGNWGWYCTYNSKGIKSKNGVRQFATSDNKNMVNRVEVAVFRQICGPSPQSQACVLLSMIPVHVHGEMYEVWVISGHSWGITYSGFIVTVRLAVNASFLITFLLISFVCFSSFLSYLPIFLYASIWSFLSFLISYIYALLFILLFSFQLCIRFSLCLSSLFLRVSSEASLHSSLFFLSPCLLHTFNSYGTSHDSWCTATLWNRIMTAQCEGWGK